MDVLELPKEFIIHSDVIAIEAYLQPEGGQPGRRLNGAFMESILANAGVDSGGTRGQIEVGLIVFEEGVPLHPVLLEEPIILHLFYVVNFHRPRAGVPDLLV